MFRIILGLIGLVYFYISFTVNSPQYQQEEAVKKQEREDRTWFEWRIKFIATEYLGKSLATSQLVAAYMQLEKAKTAGKNLDQVNLSFEEACQAYNDDLKKELSVSFSCDMLNKLIHDTRYDVAPEWKQLKNTI